ncbi:MAG: preprotein translocase subunit YajC [Ruminococcaceae bacterium]|nr:preprotein translocase subunit YajC [Oscillospiraceae bacterium]
MLVMMVVLFGVMYFFMIRPENKRKKEAENMRNALKVGDRITTIGGITGTVCHIKEDKIVIETGDDRVRVEFAKWALSTNDTQAAKAKAEAEKVAAAKKRAREEKRANRG